MERLEVSGAVRLIYRSLGVKGLFTFYIQDVLKLKKNNSGAKGLKFYRYCPLVPCVTICKHALVKLGNLTHLSAVGSRVFCISPACSETKPGKYKPNLIKANSV